MCDFSIFCPLLYIFLVTFFKLPNLRCHLFSNLPLYMKWLIERLGNYFNIPVTNSRASTEKLGNLSGHTRFLITKLYFPWNALSEAGYCESHKVLARIFVFLTSLDSCSTLFKTILLFKWLIKLSLPSLPPSPPPPPPPPLALRSLLLEGMFLSGKIKL